MNINELNAGVSNRNTPTRPYSHQEYPKMMYHPDLPMQTVQNEEQQSALARKGYGLKKLAVSSRPEVPVQLTTDMGVRSAYENLKRQYDETVADSNRRFRDLQDKYDAALEELETAKLSIASLRAKVQRRDEIISKAQPSAAPTLSAAANLDPIPEPEDEENLFAAMSGGAEIQGAEKV